jgi:RNA polymerase sigma factor (TIGR02999 family)
MSSPGDITQALLACRDDQKAFNQLVSLVYDDLHRIAHLQLGRSRPGQTLNTTSLVHEAYLKMVDQSRVEWQDRSHFFGTSARAMRQIIVDYARRRCAEKRGSGKVCLDLDRVEVAAEHQAELIMLIDDALGRLAELGDRLVRVFEYRFFAGLTEDETADILGVSVRTVQRDWKRARAWLKEMIAPEPVS